MNNRIDITDDFERANRKAERKEKWKRRLDWCIDHWEICATAFAAGIGLVTTGIKVGGKCYNNHMEYRNKNLKCYDNRLGRYWDLRRPLDNNDWIEIDRRKANGERLGEILKSIGALR